MQAEEAPLARKRGRPPCQPHPSSLLPLLAAGGLSKPSVAPASGRHTRGALRDTAALTAAGAFPWAPEQAALPAEALGFPLAGMGCECPHWSWSLCPRLNTAQLTSWACQGPAPALLQTHPSSTPGALGAASKRPGAGGDSLWAETLAAGWEGKRLGSASGKSYLDSSARFQSQPPTRPTVLPSCKAWVGLPPPAHHLGPQRYSGSWLGGLRRPRPSAGAVVPGCLHGAVFQVEGAGLGGSSASSGLRQLLAGTLVCTAY